jgi:hypothetical protein
LTFPNGLPGLYCIKIPCPCVYFIQMSDLFPEGKNSSLSDG